MPKDAYQVSEVHSHCLSVCQERRNILAPHFYNSRLTRSQLAPLPFDTVRISGIHFAHPPLQFSLFFSIIKIALGKRLRKRVKVHSGPDARVQADLAKYGLYQNVIPVEIGGQVILDQRKWLQDLRRQGK